jgi:hypothetical protein
MAGPVHLMKAVALWRGLERLRHSYAQATPLPHATFAELRAALTEIDREPWGFLHPYAHELIASTLRELRTWEETWPREAGPRVPPAAFGALVLLGDCE